MHNIPIPYRVCTSILYLSNIIITKYTDCVPQCKFGDCNITIGKCICPPGHSGVDCSVISMFLLFCLEFPNICMSMISLLIVYHGIFCL